MKNPSVMSHSFSQVPRADIPRSSFDRSHGHKTTFDAGYLIPVLCDEALPGDTFNVSLTAFARLATPIFPIMDNMVMDVHFFAVPMRLLWANWQRFCGEQDNPGDSTDFVIPTMDAPVGGHLTGSLSDYFGIPIGFEFPHSSMWHRAYNLIYNQWYRDENLQPSAFFDNGDGPDVDTNFPVLRRGKRHDYFTSCLPWPQKGDAVTIGFATNAPVFVDGTLSATEQHIHIKDNAGTDVSPYMNVSNRFSFSTAQPLLAPDFPLLADLSTATSFTINQLRESFQIQRLLERDARGGSRYTEIVRSHFGVSSPDARLQRAEYLGGGSTPVNVSPIAQTSSTDSTSPQANLSAIGTAVLRAPGFTKSFTEHSVILGLVSVRADLTYQQGLNRMFSRSTRYDFYWPALSHIGEQAVLSRELCINGTSDDDVVFGYQERFAEYRYKPSIITGLFRSAAAGSLDAWHLSQDFASPPDLNSDFIVENPPVDRVIAVPSQPHFLFDSFFRMRCARPMPVYSVPGLIDHF